MSEVLINIPDEVQAKLEIEARQQGLSIGSYIEKLLRIKAFSATLDSMRSDIGEIMRNNNIANEDDLNNYLKP